MVDSQVMQMGGAFLLGAVLAAGALYAWLSRRSRLERQRVLHLEQSRHQVLEQLTQARRQIEMLQRECQGLRLAIRAARPAPAPVAEPVQDAAGAARLPPIAAEPPQAAKGGRRLQGHRGAAPQPGLSGRTARQPATAGTNRRGRTPRIERSFYFRAGCWRAAGPSTEVVPMTAHYEVRGSVAVITLDNPPGQWPGFCHRSRRRAGVERSRRPGHRRPRHHRSRQGLLGARTSGVRQPQGAGRAQPAELISLVENCASPSSRPSTASAWAAAGAALGCHYRVAQTGTRSRCLK
jgi:hypothetical protein